MAIDVRTFIEALSGIKAIADLAAPLLQRLIDTREAKGRLQALLREAEQDFLEKARRQGLDDRIIQWTTQLPLQDLLSFRQALDDLLRHWREEALEEILAREFARIPGVAEADRARALALYLACLRARLIADESFRPVVVALSNLRIEGQLERIKEELNRLRQAIDAFLSAVSQGLVIRADQVVVQTVLPAPLPEARDPARLFRILALLAAPVHDPKRPEKPPPPLDLRQEWNKLCVVIRESRAPIYLTRLVPPTLETLRGALSPRAEAQAVFPHVFHFRGHARRDGLLLEDEYGRVHLATTKEILDALGGMPRPLDLVVLNGCESAADVESVAQALVKEGRARAAVGYIQPVYDPEAVRFAAHLYAELTNGFPLRDAVRRAQGEMAAPSVVLLGDENLRFERFTGGEPWIEDRRPQGNLYRSKRALFFFGRGNELVKIAEALASPPQVILISGPPGIGKTALALEAADRNAWRFPGGVAVAEGPRPEENRPGTADSLFNQLAEALRLRPEPGKVVEALALHVHLQPTLLIFDNVEALPPEERRRLREFLARLGERSAAIVLSRPLLMELEELPHAYPVRLDEGIGAEAAVRYALWLARERRIPLEPAQAWEIAEASDGHPLLVELIVAQAGRRDLAELLQEVRARKGAFEEQLNRVYEWSARIIEEKGQLDAWGALLLFPGGAAPEALLWAAAGREGASALQEAALADFHPDLQAWRWHATVSEYARSHCSLSDEERRSRLLELLPTWTNWLEGLSPKTPETAFQIETQQANLEAILDEAAHIPWESLRGLLQALHQALPPPDQTLSLRAFEERMYRIWAERATEEAERAIGLGMHGVALSALGRREEALQATEEAVALYRRLTQQHPQAFLPDLARSLTDLGARLSKVGRFEEAIQATEEAVALYRRLTQQHPQAFLPDLARSLTDLGARLSKVGRFEEAIQATEEAVRLFRQLTAQRPQAFLPDLARSLVSLGARLSKVSRFEEALQATEEAVRLLRQLADQHPQAFLPNLARSLNSLGLRLSEVGRFEEGLQATEEAVRLLRQLADQHLQAFLPYLAGSLNSLGLKLSEVGRFEEALRATEEAIRLFRQLVDQHPQAFRPKLARSLGAYGRILLSLGRASEACAAFAEGLRQILPFAQALPAAFRDLAAALQQDYLEACREAGQEPERELIEEASRVL